MIESWRSDTVRWLRDQPFLLPPDMRDWLPPGHPVHLVIEVVEHHLDTTRGARDPAGGPGLARPAMTRTC